jgi:hypothetical protein
MPLSLHLRARLLCSFTRRACEGTSSAFGWAGLSACGLAWLSASSGLLSSVNAFIGFAEYYLRKDGNVKEQKNKYNDMVFIEKRNKLHCGKEL